MRAGSLNNQLGELLAQRLWETDEPGMIRRQVDHVFTDPTGPSQDSITEFWLDDAGRPERIKILVD